MVTWKHGGAQDKGAWTQQELFPVRASLEQQLALTPAQIKVAKALTVTRICYESQYAVRMANGGIYYCDFLLAPGWLDIVVEIDDSRHWSDYRKHDADARLAELHQCAGRFVTWRSNQWVAANDNKAITNDMLRLAHQVARLKGIVANGILTPHYALPCQDPDFGFELHLAQPD